MQQLQGATQAETMTQRSDRYWRKFVANADLRAVDTCTGRPVSKNGRGTWLVKRGREMVTAGLWTDVQVKAMNHDAWIDLDDVPVRTLG